MLEKYKREFDEGNIYNGFGELYRHLLYILS